MDADVTEITSGLRFPEGPVWMPDGSLLCTELLGGTVVRVQPDGKKETVSENGGSPNGLAIGPDGAVYVCNSGGYGSHDVGGLTIPDSYLPQDHTGGRIERVDIATGDVKAVGIGDIDADTAVVFVAADGSVTNKTTKGKAQPRSYRFRLTLVREKDKWLTSDLQILN